MNRNSIRLAKLKAKLPSTHPKSFSITGGDADLGQPSTHARTRCTGTPRRAAALLAVKMPIRERSGATVLSPRRFIVTAFPVPCMMSNTVGRDQGFDGNGAATPPVAFFLIYFSVVEQQKLALSPIGDGQSVPLPITTNRLMLRKFGRSLLDKLTGTSAACQRYPSGHSTCAGRLPRQAGPGCYTGNQTPPRSGAGAVRCNVDRCPSCHA